MKSALNLNGIETQFKVNLMLFPIMIGTIIESLLYRMHIVIGIFPVTITFFHSSFFFTFFSVQNQDSFPPWINGI